MLGHVSGESWHFVVTQIHRKCHATQAILPKTQRCMRSIFKFLCKIEYRSIFVSGQNGTFDVYSS